MSRCSNARAMRIALAHRAPRVARHHASDARRRAAIRLHVWARDRDTHASPHGALLLPRRRRR